VTHRGALRSPGEIRRMFDRIARRYDLMNRLMTFGRDVAWRRQAAREALVSSPRCVLDVATGTADLALELARQGAVRVIALDFSLAMLRLAARKRAATGRPLSLLCGDAMRLPFRDASLDACTIAFGLRNLPDYRGALSEFARVLRPGGRLVVLETTPLRGPLAPLLRLYFDRVVPWLGGLISGDPDAYQYLPRSTAAFPAADDLADLLRSVGFSPVIYRTFMLGAVALHIGVRAASPVELAEAEAVTTQPSA
jgi:demethylmenaquinone methyltransferase/2-methoxy-6-polyprenyl-1,4-benzoquinol methylase